MTGGGLNIDEPYETLEDNDATFIVEKKRFRLQLIPAAAPSFYWVGDPGRWNWNPRLYGGFQILPPQEQVIM